MDPITHLLAGACIARTGLNRKTALATVSMVLAAEAPDIDVLARLKGPVFGFVHNRGFTHSLIGAGLVSAAVVCFVYGVWCFKGREAKNSKSPPRWGLLLSFSYLAGLSHILLDFTDNYGVRPYWPFSDRWYSWDIVDIADPVVTVLLLGGLLVPALSNLMNNELGQRRKAPHGRLGATLALLGVVAVWGIRDHEHRRALHALGAGQYEGARPIRTSAYPSWWNPYLWKGVVETSRFVAGMRVYSSTLEVDRQGEMQVRYKPVETQAITAAKNSYLGRAYMNWSKCPIIEPEPLELGKRGYFVRFRDLRFDYSRRVHYFPSASVRLSHNLSVAAMDFTD